MNSDPALKSAVRGERLDVSVSGSWTAANVQALEPLVETVVHEAAGRRLHRSTCRPRRYRHIRRVPVE